MVSLVSSLSLVLCTLLVQVDSSCLPADILVLQAIKESVNPSTISSTCFLNTWNFDSDPCETTGTHFLGILCSIPQDNHSESRITAINLEGDGLEGFLTPAIGSLTELTELNLKRNYFRGPISPSITNLRMLTVLQLSNNYFSGTIPSDLSNLKMLDILDLSKNSLTGTIPESLSALRGLTHLNLAGNLISGHISSIKKLQNLKTLDISDNRMTGSIIPEILMFPSINYINVSANLFTSISLLKATHQPSQLQVFDAHDNRLHGSLPLNLVTYANLTSIYLGSNLFSDMIPEEYGGKLRDLSWSKLFLDYNFLEGNLPLEFIRYATRIRGSLAHNCLHCPMYVTLCRGRQRQASECFRQNGGRP